MNINQKIKDCIYGLAVGDALGLPYEFQEREIHLKLKIWKKEDIGINLKEHGLMILA